MSAMTGCEGVSAFSTVAIARAMAASAAWRSLACSRCCRQRASASMSPSARDAWAHATHSSCCWRRLSLHAGAPPSFLETQAERVSGRTADPPEAQQVHVLGDELSVQRCGDGGQQVAVLQEVDHLVKDLALPVDHPHACHLRQRQ